MKVLGIETSCDETAAAVVDGRRVLSNVVFSQVRLHRRYAGVVPELAARAHLQKIAPVIEEALGRSGGGKPDAVAFTQGPGLMGPLLVGKMAAEALAWVLGVPLVGVNHLEGHVFAAELENDLEYPLAALVVSGGHTDLLLCHAPGRYRLLGRTRDDAAGEAFDKVAKLLGLGYPGGPAIDRVARAGEADSVRFPRPFMPETWDFSFSGLKTSVLYHLRDGGGDPRGADVENLCASFQEAVVDALVEKTFRAAERFKVRGVVIGGGVAANSRLREKALAEAKRRGIRTVFPAPGLCTDNGAMIARAAARRLSAGAAPRKFRCDPSMTFRNWLG